MDLKELFTEIGIEVNEEMFEKLNSAFDKTVQSETDKVRTEYSKKVKKLEKFKPVEQSAEQIELANLKKELADTKFSKTLKDIGVDDSLAKFIRSDANVEELGTFIKGFAQAQKDFIPNNMNQNESSITKEEFKNMNYQQKAELYEKSPELFQLLNQK